MIPFFFAYFSLVSILAGVLTVAFVSAKSVVGDKAEFWCDGTNWFCTAECSVFDAITFA